MQQIVRKALDTFFLLRIPLLAPVWTILLLGWIIGTDSITPFQLMSSQNGVHVCHGALWIALIGFSFIVASIYVVNQIVDIESDRINHKLFLLPHGFISVRSAWILATFCAVTGLLLTLFFDRIMFLFFLISLILGIFYNLPPFRLKDRAWGGIFANSLGHGLLTFLVGWYVAKLVNGVHADLLKDGLISGIAPALANGAVFLTTTIPDASGDRQTGKQTFCVRYGEKATAIVAALLCLGALISSFFMENHFWVMTIPSAISLVFFFLLVFSTKREQAFKTFKWPVFLLSAFVAFYIPVYGLLILATFYGSKAYYRWRFGIDYPTFKAQ